MSVEKDDTKVVTGTDDVKTEKPDLNETINKVLESVKSLSSRIDKTESLLNKKVTDEKDKSDKGGVDINQLKNDMKNELKKEMLMETAGDEFKKFLEETGFNHEETNYDTLSKLRKVFSSKYSSTDESSDKDKDKKVNSKSNPKTDNDDKTVEEQMRTLFFKGGK